MIDPQFVEKLREHRLMGKSLDRHCELKRRTTIHVLHSPYHASVPSEI
jgi:hypothetical protein